MAALGLWFAAIAAGYAIDKFIATAPAGRTRAIVSWSCVIALAFPLTLGLTQSRTFATSWPHAPSYTALLAPPADHTPNQSSPSCARVSPISTRS